MMEKPITLNELLAQNKDIGDKPVYVSVFSCGCEATIPVEKEDVKIHDDMIILNADYN